MASLDGRTLGHFRVERMIGSGGMGAVYEAVDEKLERQVALKVLLQEGDNASNRKRFLREARLAAKLTHPNIATVFEVGEFENHLYIVMELLEGQALRKLLFTQRLSTDQSIGIARDMARALAKAHAAGITHRDIKPENVFITTPAPDVLTAKVLDFGLARQQRAQQPKHPHGVKKEESTSTGATAPGDILGTPGYWSPEQARSGEVDVRTDVFSFGIVLYEMLTGRQAFKANTTVALVLAVTRHEPEPIRKYVPNIAPQLEELVSRCIKKDPAERFADGTELLAAVEAVARALGRTSSFDLDDITAADKEPPVRLVPDAPRPPPSTPVASAPTPGATTLDEMSAAAPAAAFAPFASPERLKLFGAIGAGLAGAGLVLILITVLLGSSARSKTAAAAPETTAASATATTTAPAVTAPVAPAELTEPAAPAAPAVEPVAATPPAIITPTPLAAPAVSIVPTPLVTAAPAATATAPRPASTSGGAATAGTGAGGVRPHGDRKGDCAQPFTVDAKGVKIPKMHCL